MHRIILNQAFKMNASCRFVYSLLRPMATLAVSNSVQLQLDHPTFSSLMLFRPPAEVEEQE
jgi:hypothetical protein